MKYIDSEKLIAEIQRLKDIYPSWQVKSAMDDLCDFTASLQQEQPMPRWIHANYSSKPEIRHTPSGTPYLQNGPYMIWLSDLETLPKDGTYLTNPGPVRLAEVDLEKFDREVTKIWGKCAADPNDSIACLHIETFNEIARHFYELGLNARKEE